MYIISLIIIGGIQVPYWILDINECVRYEFHEATKLLETELFNGRSLKERWDNVVFIGEVDDISN